MDQPDTAAATAGLVALHEANRAKARGNELYKSGDLDSAATAYAEGISRLLAERSSPSDVLDLLTTLRGNRAACSLTLARDVAAENKTKSSSWARDVITDCTAVLDMRKHATPVLVLRALSRRASAIEILHELKVATDDDLRQAAEDASAVISDGLATEDQRKRALQVRTVLGLECCNDSPSGTGRKLGKSESIQGCFLTREGLKEVASLRVGSPGEPSHSIAKTFMNKTGPVRMSDGTPKDPPPGVPMNSLMGMNAEQLNLTLGVGAGTYFGEVVFWKQRRGIRLGKIKWESSGEMQSDTATMGEFWDMRWVFPSEDDAKGFHDDMLSASRAEGGNGYLEGPNCFVLRLGPHELAPDEGERRPRIHDAVLFGNRPKKRAGGSPSFHMVADPTLYLQQYGLVFRVDRVVIKVMVFEGFNPPRGRGLTRAAALDIARAAALAAESWLGYPNGGSGSRGRQGRSSAGSKQTHSVPARSVHEPTFGIADADAEPALVRSFFAHAAALREKEPWELSGAQTHSFRLQWTHAGPKKDVIVQILGSGGRHCGLQIWQNFDALIKDRKAIQRGDTDRTSPIIVVDFLDPDGEFSSVLERDIALARRVDAEYPPHVSDPLNRLFPKIWPCADNSAHLSPDDVCLAEAAMAMSVLFFAHLVAVRPVPPAPYPTAYSFEPCSAALCYETGYGCGDEGIVERECVLTYPAGNVSLSDQPWSSYPELVRKGAARPKHVITIRQAAEFHRSELRALGPLTRCRVRLKGLKSRPDLNGTCGMAVSFAPEVGRYSVQLDGETGSATIAVRPTCLEEAPQLENKTSCFEPKNDASYPTAGTRWRANMYGLANAFWEMETAADVSEACALAETILVNQDTCDDADGIATFLLDLYLESGKWDQALRLMKRFKPRKQLNQQLSSEELRQVKHHKDTWAWTTALVRLRKDGADSLKANEAIRAAVHANHFVFPFLVRDKPVPDDMNAVCAVDIRWMPDGSYFSPELDEMSAKRYMWTYRKHWWSAGGKEMLRAVRIAGEDAYRAACEERATSLASSAFGFPKVEEETQSTPRVPKSASSICAHCGKLCQVRLCAKCKAVGYCGRDCQVAHFKKHKKDCKKVALKKAQRT